MKLKEQLLKMSKNELTDMIINVLDLLSKDDYIDFVSKYIDSKFILSYIGEDDSKVFINKVKKFCKECLSEKYYIDTEEIYRNNYDYYEDDESSYDEIFEDSEWAKKFNHYFKVANIYFGSNDFSTAYIVFDTLLECILTMDGNEDYLGTENPMAYIVADWIDILTNYIKMIFNCITDESEAISKALQIWHHFSEYCTEGLITYLPNIKIATKLILKEIKSNSWHSQRALYNSLIEILVHKNIPFDKLQLTTELLEIQPRFYVYIIEDYYKSSDWKMVITYYKAALPVLSSMDKDYDIRNLINSIKIKLADAYENLSDFKQAYLIVSKMLHNNQNYELYIKARSLTDKFMDVSDFIRDFLKNLFLKGSAEKVV